MPIRCKRADKISSLHFHFELTSYFHGNITTIRIIKQIFKRNYHRIGAIIGQSCIVSVIDRYKANIHNQEYLFQISSHFDIVSAQTG